MPYRNYFPLTVQDQIKKSTDEKEEEPGEAAHVRQKGRFGDRLGDSVGARIFYATMFVCVTILIGCIPRNLVCMLDWAFQIS